MDTDEGTDPRGIGRWPVVREDHGYETECLVWQGARTAKGYGETWNGSTVVYAHRLAYEHHVGPIPERLQIDHLCRVRACVNPSHLEAVTLAENGRRGKKAKLNPEKVRELRALAGDGWSANALATRYGIAPASARRIVQRLWWKDID